MRTEVLRTVVCLLALVVLSKPLRAEQVWHPSELRFSRHIVPILSRLGCNSGFCHGAVQGQNGFRLSLFGIDPVGDHERLTREVSGRRINRLSPSESLLLLKATAQVPHEGGRRLEPGSPEYRILHDWIAQGAALDVVSDSIVERLSVRPANHSGAVGDIYDLKVEAEFADGSREDVTRLCSFEPRDLETATATPEGRVTLLSPGDTAVVVRYPGQVAFATVLAIPTSTGKYAEVREQNFIDRHVLQRLQLLDIPPSELCDDATFLRRISLDVAGSLPTPDDIRSFLADDDPRKRERKIDELLGRPGHSALWGTKFCDILRLTGYERTGYLADEYRAYCWLRARLEENVPYDELVERIVCATSREGRSYEEWAEECLQVALEEAGGEYPATYAARRTLDLYWQRKMNEVVDPAIRVAHAFLGLRIQCAQCHRHPDDVWTQDDLLSFANFFLRVPTFSSLAGKRGGTPRSRRGQPSTEIELVEQATIEKLKAQAKKASGEEAKLLAAAESSFKRQFGREVELITDAMVAAQIVDEKFATVTSPLGTQSSEQLRLPGMSRPVATSTGNPDRRRVVMDWMRQPANPFFARVIVNRVWAHYFDRGIIDPPDDLSPLNPPSHPELLDELCRRFIDSGYDLKWLHRTILTSRTYQQSSVLKAGNTSDRRNYASFSLRRLPAEVLLDAVNQASGTVMIHAASIGRQRLSLPEGTLFLEGGSLAQRTSGSSGTFALDTFGRPPRDVEVQCDCDRENEATMLQALFLANHPQVRAKIADPNGRVAQLLTAPVDDDRRIAELFLWTVSRFPTEEERTACLEFVSRADSPKAGLEGVLWALLNSDGFLFQR